MSALRHNHFTRDIKPPGKCPACDDYWQKRPVEPSAPVAHPDGATEPASDLERDPDAASSVADAPVGQGADEQIVGEQAEALGGFTKNEAGVNRR